MKFFYSILTFLVLSPIISCVILFYFYYKGGFKLSDFIQIEVMIATLVSAISIVVTFIIQYYYKIKIDKETKIDEIEKFIIYLLIYKTQIRCIYEESIKKTKIDTLLSFSMDLDIRQFTNINQILMMSKAFEQKDKKIFSCNIFNNIQAILYNGKALRSYCELYNKAIKNNFVLTDLRVTVTKLSMHMFVSLFFVTDLYLTLLKIKYKRNYIDHIKKEESYEEDYILFTELINNKL